MCLQGEPEGEGEAAPPDPMQVDDLLPPPDPHAPSITIDQHWAVRAPRRRALAMWALAAQVQARA